MNIEKALIFPAWLFFRLLSHILWYPTVGVLHVTAWLAEGYRDAGRPSAERNNA